MTKLINGMTKTEFVTLKAKEKGVSINTIYRWIREAGGDIEKALDRAPQTAEQSRQNAAKASPWRYKRFGRGYDLSKGRKQS